jgi:hypothetical protein
MREQGMEIVRYGRFAVLDRGVPQSEQELAADQPRYAVVEHDDLGPILRDGPFRDLGIAVERCQQFSFRDDLSVPAEEHS